MINVFVQLIENAIKFTENGYIQISVRELKNDVECSIADTGTGIPAKDLPWVFELFPYAEDARNVGGYDPKFNLSIIKGIIEKHKGKIWVESEIGKGTKFTFILPKVRICCKITA
jgi:signal transduction histidine kinase